MKNKTYAFLLFLLFLFADIPCEASDDTSLMSPSSSSSQLPRRLTYPQWITLMAFCTSAGHTASSSLTCHTQGCCTGRWSLSGRRDRRRRTPLTWVQTHLSRCSRHSETRSRCFRFICAFLRWWVCLQQQLIISGSSWADIDSLFRVGSMVWLAAEEWPADVAALRVQLPPQPELASVIKCLRVASHVGGLIESVHRWRVDVSYIQDVKQSSFLLDCYW